MNKDNSLEPRQNYVWLARQTLDMKPIPKPEPVQKTSRDKLRLSILAADGLHTPTALRPS